MNLSDKNKNVLEKALNCKIEVKEKTDDPSYEFYAIGGIYPDVGYNKKEKYYFIVNNYINKLSKCNEIIILNAGPYYVDFMVLNDLKNIDI